MHNLSMNLDSVVCRVATAADGEVMHLMSSAVLLSDGWVFSIPEHWHELEETLGAGRPDRVVTLEQAIARPGHAKTKETPPGVPPEFNRIDYLAALFGAAADLALEAVPRSAVNLMVAAPGTIICADPENRQEVKRPRTTSPATNGSARLYVFDPQERSLFADIRRAAARAGFGRSHVSAAALEGARHLVLSTTPQATGVRKKLEESDTYLACAVELGAQGIALTPIKLVSEPTTASVDFGAQCLFLQLDWQQLLRDAVDEKIGRQTPKLAEAVWSHVALASVTGKLPAPLIDGSRRYSFPSLDLDIRWDNAASSIARAILAGEGIQPGKFVSWLALPPGNENHPIVHFFVQGLGSALPPLRAAIEGVFAGKPKEARDRRDRSIYGLLDTEGLDMQAAPQPIESNGNAAATGLHLEYSASNASQPTPADTAVYKSVSVQPSSVTRDAVNLDMNLLMSARPALNRSSFLDRDAVRSFALALVKTSGDVHQATVVFKPQPWETNYRLEVEVRADNGDRLTVQTRIGGRRVAVEFEKPKEDGVKAVLCKCIGLGTYEIAADEASRELANVMSTEQVRAAAKYQVFKPESVDA